MADMRSAEPANGEIGKLEMAAKSGPGGTGEGREGPGSLRCRCSGLTPALGPIHCPNGTRPIFGGLLPTQDLRGFFDRYRALKGVRLFRSPSAILRALSAQRCEQNRVLL